MKPYNEKKILQRKIRNGFEDAKQREKAIAVLNEYGKESHEQEPDRVRLAILKISGNDLTRIEKNTQYAKQDFRDTLVAAEYPGQGSRWMMPDGPEKQALTKKDRMQYENWLDEA